MINTLMCILVKVKTFIVMAQSVLHLLSIFELLQRLNMANYIKIMGTLLHLEEIQMELDIAEYSMDRVGFWFLCLLWNLVLQMWYTWG